MSLLSIRKQFQAFPLSVGNSTRHGRDMSRIYRYTWPLRLYGFRAWLCVGAKALGLCLILLWIIVSSIALISLIPEWLAQ